MPDAGYRAAPVSGAQRRPGEQRLKCRGGPLDGERVVVPAGTTEVAVPLPRPEPSDVPLAALYRVEPRRRARGPVFAVLAFVRKVPATAPGEAHQAAEMRERDDQGRTADGHG